MSYLGTNMKTIESILCVKCQENTYFPFCPGKTNCIALRACKEIRRATLEECAYLVANGEERGYDSATICIEIKELLEDCK
jgi:hypothetical protein